MEALPSEARNIGRYAVRQLAFDEWRPMLQSQIPWGHQANKSRAIKALRAKGYIDARRCAQDDRRNEYRLSRKNL